ncbi:MAG TPA: response regulator [Pseudomonas sp.]|uniref:response regulator transcription factor n=1 Tax=Pseudomonas sp. TaxID=306 RepID=UPI002BE338F4|nr:response regulator [Pseudomonas sp.]HWH89430.1 response regulator [Pseudomonas sp.]
MSGPTAADSTRPTIVCIVDDDASVRKSLSNLLRAVGYRAQVYASGEAFLTDVDFDEIACLLLDLRMPGLSGIDVMRELPRQIPVICMSAHWDEATLAETGHYQAFECLCKPFEEEVLLAALDKALQRQR